MTSGPDRLNGTADPISFGPFRLEPTQRLLLRGTTPVHIGSRAFDILLVLLERPGELVTKDELMARVWPSTFVEPANLAVHIAGLRRALDDGRWGHRYVVNIPGRGYRFVAPIADLGRTQSSAAVSASSQWEHNLPAHLTDPIGRDDAIDQLGAMLLDARTVTVVGPGGAGKTTVARTLAEKLVGAYEHGVWLVDLAAINESSSVAVELATVLGVEGREPVGALAAALQDKRTLVLFDNCEQVVAAVAGLTTCILKAAPGVQVLATSREPLRSEGEYLYRLSPLMTPTKTSHISAEEASTSPAVQLFVERAARTLGKFELSDREAPVVAEICRRLDGLPLALELAAARLETLGVQGLATCLADSLDLLTEGRRTDLPRQQSLRGTLDWSHALLSDVEQAVFRRLAIFPGKFTLGDAQAVAGDETDNVAALIGILGALVTKSMLMADCAAESAPYHLLGTVRAYGLSKLNESGEMDGVHDRYQSFHERADTVKVKAAIGVDHTGIPVLVRGRRNVAQASHAVSM
jgi:predicted ATPase/DNA-binding winged helix-turn-helix (wHTH) protein